MMIHHLPHQTILEADGHSYATDALELLLLEQKMPPPVALYLSHEYCYVLNEGHQTAEKPSHDALRRCKR